jgi:error-prone DNA polymerase
MTERGYTLEYAERIYQQICGFGEYGFPESHSASFALLAYTSAWLKHHYPAAFYTALLNSLPMGFYSPSQLVQDARRHAITVLPVCVNHSAWEHILERKEGALAVRLGMRLVKGLSEEGAQTLVDARARNKHRRFERIDEVRRLALRKNELEALASADAFHSLGGDRYRTRWQLMDSEAELPLFCDSSDVAKSSDATNAHKESPPAMRVAESPAVFLRAAGVTDHDGIRSDSQVTSGDHGPVTRVRRIDRPADRRR